MDRTSILGDTIDYMKELLEKVKNLGGEEDTKGSMNQVHLMGKSKELKPNELLVRNSPKVCTYSIYIHIHVYQRRLHNQANTQIPRS